MKSEKDLCQFLSHTSIREPLARFLGSSAFIIIGTKPIHTDWLFFWIISIICEATWYNNKVIQAKGANREP